MLDDTSLVKELADESLLAYFEENDISHITLVNHNQLIYLISHLSIVEKILQSIVFYQNNSILNKIICRLSEAELRNFLNADVIALIDQSPKKFIIIKILFASDSPSLLPLLEKSLFADYIINHFNQVSSFLDQMDTKKAIILFHNILVNAPDKLEYIIQLSPINQLAVIKNIGINSFYSIVTEKNLFTYLADEVITILIEKNPFYHYFTELPIKTIAELISRGLIIPENLAHNQTFINALASVPDPNEYRMLQNSIMNNAYNNFRRRKALHVEACVNYFNENNLSYNAEEMDKIYGDHSLLKNRYYNYLFDDSYLEETRTKYYDDIVSKISSNKNLLPEYYAFFQNPYMGLNLLHDNNSYLLKDICHCLNSHGSRRQLYRLLYQATTRRFHEILIDRFYKDVAYNFLINLNNVVTFYTSYGLKNIKDKNFLKRIQRYQTILSFSSLKRSEQIAFYHSFDAAFDYAKEFYEDYQNARMLAYRDMNNSVLNLRSMTTLFNPHLTQKYGVNIYELKGEPFYAYIHLTNIERRQASKEGQIWKNRIEEFLNEPLVDIEFPIGISISLASHRKLETVRSVKKYVTFGYFHLNPKRIAHVYHADSYSTFKRSGVGMCKINEIETTDSLTSKTRKYNEILYQEVSDIILDPEVLKQYEQLKPDYLFCYDDISVWDVYVAHRLNISILLVHTNCYDNEIDNYCDFNHDNEYITSLEKTYKIKTYIKK